jgi:Transglycosylase SLT domain
VAWTEKDEQELGALKSAQQEMLQAQYGELPPMDPKGYVDLFHPFFRRVELERGLPAGLISGMAEKESTGNALVRSKVKGSTAAGLFQINDRTARDWRLAPEERLDPVIATIAAADKLAARARKYGIERAVGMHYGGEGTPFERVIGGQTPRGYAESVFSLAQRYAGMP